MKEGFLTFLICVFLLALGFGFMYFIINLDKVTVVETVDNSVETVDNCEHDWVLTSEYVWLTGAYRNVSKCSRCGKVVK